MVEFIKQELNLEEKPKDLPKKFVPFTNDELLLDLIENEIDGKEVCDHEEKV
jgi:hypothetical protein